MVSEKKLIQNVKTKRDPESLRKIIDKHSGIYVDMVNKYIPESKEGIYKKDILEDKNYCIYEAIIKFDETKKTKFSTYLGNLAKWKCLNLYNKKIKFPQESIESTKVDKYFCDSDIKKMEDVENLQNIYSIVQNSKDERVKKIFKMRYSDNKKLMPWKKIAKKLDLSIQGCINIHNNYLKEIKKYVQ
jgi:DNA-directed RNA polymerase specialized sigma subunit